MTIHLLIILISIIQTQVQAQLPQAFTIVRNIQTWVTYDDFLVSIARPSYDTRLNIVSGYNMASLAGFTQTSTYQGMDNQLSPLLLWKKVYEMIMGNKPNLYGTTSPQIQKYILQNIFHQNGSKILMHVDLLKFPVSATPSINATTLAQQIVTTLTQLQLDGVSINFNDHNSVKDGSGSDWLEILLRYIRINTQNTDTTIVLIIPPTFVGRMKIFKSADINYLVDYFVLKYYGTVQADYTSYQTIFQKSSSYPGTSIFELLSRPDIYIDICRTMIAKPADQSATWSYTQYTSANDLNNIFGQAYTKMGWFGGFGNLNFQTDKGLGFVNTVLGGLRENCARDENCVC